jgi:GMP reductase
MAKIINDVKLNFDDVLIVPKPNSLNSRKDVNLNVTFKFPHSKQSWYGIPIIASNMTTVASFEMAKALSKHDCMTAIHKYYSAEELKDFFNTGISQNYAWYTLGTNPDDWEKLKKVNTNKLNINKICIDVANGYRDSFVDSVKKLRDENPGVTIMAGNVVTSDQTIALINAGADIVKVGIGSSPFCTTRLQAGVGVPQLSAIIECSEAAYELDAFICSDGGCRKPGDIAKAFGAMSGPNFVMLGSMLAGHDETQAKKIIKDGKEFVECYGMSSEKAMREHNNGMAKYRTSEGRHVLIPARGPVENTILDILGGIRSCCTYLGANSLSQLSENTTFIKVNETHNKIYEKFDINNQI